MLLTTPGIGLIPGLTIMLEVGDLACVHVQAADHCIRVCQKAQRFFQLIISIRKSGVITFF